MRHEDSRAERRPRRFMRMNGSGGERKWSCFRRRGERNRARHNSGVCSTARNVGHTTPSPRPVRKNIPVRGEGRWGGFGVRNWARKQATPFQEVPVLPSEVREDGRFKAIRNGILRGPL